MGSTNSRHGSRPHTPSRPKQNLRRTLSSIFICGSASSTSPIEMVDDSAEDCRDLDDTTKFRGPRKEFALPSGTQFSLTRPRSGNEESTVNENPSPEDGARTSAEYRSSYVASTSDEDKQIPDPCSSNERVNMSSVDGNDDTIERVTQSNPESPRAFEDLLGVENEIPEREVTDLGSVDETAEETIPSLLGFLETEREQEHRDEVVRRDDVMSISSDNLSRANTEMNPRELRFDGRRLIWDALLRQNGGRRGDSQTFTFSTDDSDESGSRGRWLRDFGDDSFDGGARGDSRYLGSRTRNIAALRQRSSSEIWESIRRGSHGFHRETGICSSGLHAYGTCSCEEISMDQDFGPRASISRIVMLAETLFEVLDEIQRQPVPLSLSMGSLPAPESVVNSLPVKNHRIKQESENDIEQCHICLAEYKEGDEIRVLPCHHEYHMSCVDKWLKEIHRICPLCRGDVCGDNTRVSNTETPLA